MLTAYPEQLVAKEDIYLDNENEPSFDCGGTYDIVAVDESLKAFIALSEWGEIQAILFSDERFVQKGETKSFRDCTFMYEGAVVSGKWVWEKQKTTNIKAMDIHRFFTFLLDVFCSFRF